MTLDREDIKAIAAEVVQLLPPMLVELGLVAAIRDAEPENQGLTDHEMVMMMAQPDLLGAIRAREKRLRERRKRKSSRP